jgi:hypothetical protein
MKTTQGMFSEAFIDRVAKEHGVDQNQLPSKDEIERQTIKKRNRRLLVSVLRFLQQCQFGRVAIFHCISSFLVGKSINKIIMN